MHPTVYTFEVSVSERAGLRDLRTADYDTFTGTTAQFMGKYSLVTGDGSHRATGRVERNGFVFEWYR